MAVKQAKKKSAKRKPVKKKSVRKKVAKKKGKVAGKRKKASRKKSRARAQLDLVGSELPKSLKAFGRQLRRDLTALEKQIELARKDTRRSLARVVRDASHQLGVLEARGEREWRSLSRTARRDIERIVKRVQKVVRG